MKKGILTVVIAVAALFSCRELDESATPAARLQLSANRQLWLSQAIHDYSYDYDLASSILTRPLHIEVRADTVNQVTDRESAAEYANAGMPTVDSLFARVEALIANPDNGVTVQYNATLGYPESIAAGYTIPDVGYVITVTNLVRTP